MGRDISHASGFEPKIITSQQAIETQKWIWNKTGLHPMENFTAWPSGQHCNFAPKGRSKHRSWWDDRYLMMRWSCTALGPSESSISSGLWWFQNGTHESWGPLKKRARCGAFWYFVENPFLTPELVEAASEVKDTSRWATCAHWGSSHYHWTWAHLHAV